MTELQTPALIIDKSILDDNIAVALNLAKNAGIVLRPHAKSHKSPDLAHRTIAAGAIGCCVATIDEAEAMAYQGVPGILVTAPLVSRSQLARLADLMMFDSELSVVADHPVGVAALSSMARACKRELNVLVECDVGNDRTGVRSIKNAVILADQINACPNLHYAGIQAYWGQLQQSGNVDARQVLVHEQAERLTSIVKALTTAELPPSIITGGGTGTFGIDRHLNLFTELQPGSFLFMDSAYSATGIELDGTNPFLQALFVQATVININAQASNQPKIIINAGFKAFATDSGHPQVVEGCPPGTTFQYMGDEHGALLLPEPGSFKLGQTVELIPSHCDPTINLYAHYHIRENKRFVGSWDIQGRYGDTNLAPKVVQA